MYIPKTHSSYTIFEKKSKTCREIFYELYLEIFNSIKKTAILGDSTFG